MMGIDCADLASCAAIAAQVDAALGYPRAGVDIGGGVHAPPSQSVTTTYSGPVPLATAGRYGYPVDATNMPALTAQQQSQVSALALTAQQQGSVSS